MASESLGFLVDKIATINSKLFIAQDDLYRVRRMSFEEFKTEFSTEEKMFELYNIFKKAMDLNVQRSAQIKVFDQQIVKMIKDAISGVDIDDGVAIQDQHKTY